MCWWDYRSVVRQAIIIPQKGMGVLLIDPSGADTNVTAISLLELWMIPNVSPTLLDCMLEDTMINATTLRFPYPICTFYCSRPPCRIKGVFSMNKTVMEVFALYYQVLYIKIDIC
jgi:hypothetical protein